MEIKKIKFIYFSPTYSTERIGLIIANEFGCETEKIDITYFKVYEDIVINENEVVLIGMPVYGGRIPKAAAERLKNIKGNNAPAIIFAVYGNRAYDDALAQMRDIALSISLKPVGAAAFIAEHNIMNSTAKGRPDDNDISLIKNFGKNAKKKIDCNDLKDMDLSVLGECSLPEFNGVALKPKLNKKCAKCGLCAEKCPVGAIDKLSFSTNADECITCMRCIKICPKKARGLEPIKHSIADMAFKKKFGTRKEPEIFI